jgi:hypothetical protein
MRKILVLAVLVAGLISLLCLSANSLTREQYSNLGFGQHAAGGWLVTFDLGAPVEVLMNLGADGQVLFNGSLRWAGPDNTGGWLGTRYNTTGHGTWHRTGPCEMEAWALLIIQDNDGNPLMYEKGVFQLTFKDNYTRLEGEGTIWLIEMGNDPLDPEAPIFVEIPVPLATGRPIR